MGMNIDEAGCDHPAFRIDHPLCRAIGFAQRDDAAIRDANIARAVVTLPPSEQIDNAHVVVQIGGTAPSQLLRSVGIELVEKRGEA